jgi:hypothetical protein
MSAYSSLATLRARMSSWFSLNEKKANGTVHRGCETGAHIPPPIINPPTHPSTHSPETRPNESALILDYGSLLRRGLAGPHRSNQLPEFDGHAASELAAAGAGLRVACLWLPPPPPRGAEARGHSLASAKSVIVKVIYCSTIVNDLLLFCLCVKSSVWISITCGLSR